MVDMATATWCAASSISPSHPIMMVVMQNVAASIPCWKAMGQPMMLSRFQYFFLKVLPGSLCGRGR